MKKPAIGIVGGVGPAAGADLCLKVFKNTRVSCDQDHIDLYMTSCPSIIPDRTGYLLFNGQDPGDGLRECMQKLCTMGATAIGVSCNTAHSKKIMGAIDYSFLGTDTKLCNMIEETCNEIIRLYPEGAKIGLLATLGTNRTGVYDEYFAACPELELVKCSQETCEAVNAAVYDPDYGIKATPAVTAKATEALIDAANELREKGCQAVILGCTELPLALNQDNSPLPVIDPTEILARALIRATEPEKLIQ